MNGRVLERPKKSEAGETQRRKTLWDWISLLLVPLMIAGIGSGLLGGRTTVSERLKRDSERRKQRIKPNLRVTGLSRRNVATHLEKDLRSSKEGSVVRTLARAKTASVIQRLDGPRNRNVIRFLNEAQLIGQGESSIHLLAEADLQGAGLHNVDLSAADLSGANLSGANRTSANLIDANLSGANLEHANLSWARLTVPPPERGQAGGYRAAWCRADWGQPERIGWLAEWRSTCRMPSWPGPTCMVPPSPGRPAGRLFGRCRPGCPTWKTPT